MRHLSVPSKLEVDDVWQLTSNYEAERLAVILEGHFYDRVPPSERPIHLQPKAARSAGSVDQQMLGGEEEEKTSDSGAPAKEGAAAPPFVDPSAALPTVGGAKVTDEKTGTTTEGGKKYDRSLLMALNQTVFWRCARSPFLEPLQSREFTHAVLLLQVLGRRTYRLRRRRLPVVQSSRFTGFARVHSRIVRLHASLAGCRLARPPRHRLRHRPRIRHLGDAAAVFAVPRAVHAAFPRNRVSFRVIPETRRCAH